MFTFAIRKFEILSVKWNVNTKHPNVEEQDSHLNLHLQKITFFRVYINTGNAYVLND